MDVKRQGFCGLSASISAWIWATFTRWRRFWHNVKSGLDFGLHFGLDYGLDYGLDFGLDFGLKFKFFLPSTILKLLYYNIFNLDMFHNNDIPMIYLDTCGTIH